MSHCSTFPRQNNKRSLLCALPADQKMRPMLSREIPERRRPSFRSFPCSGASINSPSLSQPHSDLGDPNSAMPNWIWSRRRYSWIWSSLRDVFAPSRSRAAFDCYRRRNGQGAGHPSPCRVRQKFLIFGCGGNFDNYIWQHFNSWKVAAWKSTNKLIVNQNAKIPTTARNQKCLTLTISSSTIYQSQPFLHRAFRNQ